MKSDAEVPAPQARNDESGPTPMQLAVTPFGCRNQRAVGGTVSPYLRSMHRLRVDSMIREKPSSWRYIYT